MQKPVGYDTAQTKEFTGTKFPPAGPYVFGILRAECHKTKTSGRDAITLTLDIAKGDFKNFFRGRTDQADGKDKYLKYMQLVDGDSVAYFKGMIKAIEESNQGFKFDFDESKLHRKLVGGMIRDKEIIGNDGTSFMYPEVAFLCSVKTAESGNLTIPQAKKAKQPNNPLQGFQDDDSQYPPQASFPDQNSEDCPF